MGRDDKSGVKRGNTRRKTRSKDQSSDESDEDFIISEDEEHESDEYCSSLDPDESDMALEDFFSEEEEVTVKVKKPTRSKARKSGSTKKRKAVRKTQKKKNRLSYKQDDEYTEDDDDVEFIPDETDYVNWENETPVIKKKRNSYIEEGDDEDEDEDADEDDEEYNIREDDQDFTIDEFFEDEEDLLLQKKNKNVRNLPSREKDIVRGQKRKRNLEMINKPALTSKKKRTNRRLARKTSSGLAKNPTSDSDEEFANKSVLVEDKNKKILVQRERNFSADSDPDFLYSPASDDEDITNEERKDHRLADHTSSGIAANKSVVVEDKSKNKFSGRRKKIVQDSDSDADPDFTRVELSDDGFAILEEEKEHKLVEQSNSVTFPIPQLGRQAGFGMDAVSNSVELEDRSKKVPTRRRRFVAVSESDDTCSASSDYEYSISDEENEHISKVDKVGSSLKTNLRSSYSLKEFEKQKDTCKLRKQLGKKGKEKLEDINKVVKQVCGICLSEEGKRTVRGTLNCCSHFFCFACIMEWSKVESRCPLCKQRFVTVSKPARSDSGFDLRTVVIQIPECDQVYQPSEEELRGFLDPYDGVICTECQQGGDDALMLLCDICDSPAHTYCVGLGHEVPEGNWYCEGCRPAACGNINSNGLNSMLDQRASHNLSSMSSPVYSVAELDLNTLYVPETPLTQQIGFSPIPRRFGNEYHGVSPTSGSGAFTVFDRRRIQRQIHSLLSTRWNSSSIQSNGMRSTTSGIRLFGSQIDGGAGQVIQRAVNPEMRLPQYASRDERLHDTTTLLPTMDASSARSIQLSELRQNPEHVGSSMSFNPFNSRLAYDHLHPCNSRSNIDSDGSSYSFRETTVPSRTSQ